MSAGNSRKALYCVSLYIIDNKYVVSVMFSSPKQLYITITKMHTPVCQCIGVIVKICIWTFDMWVSVVLATGTRTYFYFKHINMLKVIGISLDRCLKSKNEKMVGQLPPEIPIHPGYAAEYYNHHCDNNSLYVLRIYYNQSNYSLHIIHFFQTYLFIDQGCI